MAEICWRAKNLFQDAKFERKPMENDEQHENDAAFEDYKDSDNDDDDVEPYEVLFEFQVITFDFAIFFH